MAKWTAADIPDQSGRTILITGANSGLGLRSAEALARAGAQVLLACRSEIKATAARDAVQ
jgi:NAD(P)-dependent dehydrogenase (short-subunit alcohol dehydrogenase family)